LVALIDLYLLFVTIPELRGEMCTVRLFSQGVDLFALTFYSEGSSSVNHSWHQKTRDSGLPDGEDRISLRSLVLTQYRSVIDGQTDRQTDGAL